MESTYQVYQKESLKISWYEFKPGNGTRYEFGLSKPPFFMQGCDPNYLVIILPHAYYAFTREELLNGIVNAYHCEKLNLNQQDAEELFKFIRENVLKGEF